MYCDPFHPNTNPNPSPNLKPSPNCSRKSDSKPIQTSFDVSHHIDTPPLLYPNPNSNCNFNLHANPYPNHNHNHDPYLNSKPNPLPLL